MNRLSRYFASLLFVCSLQPALANTANSAPEGSAIGSAGFNELLDKQKQPGMFTTEPQPDGSFLLSNKMQTVSARITPQGVQFDSIGNSAGKGGFSLQLAQWGRAGALQAAQSSQIYVKDDVVYHTHLGGIAEKFSNTNDGIRQDFIIPLKPAGSGALQVQLQVSDATVEQKDDAAVIQLASGRRLTYNQLQVTDSTGKAIPAQMQVAQNNMVTVLVDDASAQYPLTIDPTVGDENWVSIGNGSLPGTNGTISAAVYFGSTLYIGGGFTAIGDARVNYIAQWNGSSWSALGSGVNSDVHELTVDSSGNVYAGGAFTTAGGMANTSYIAKWNGTAWSALGSGTNNIVRTLTLDGNGNLYAGGDFTTAGGVAASKIAKWNGTAWSALGSGMEAGVWALAVDSSGNVYAGGAFTMAGGVAAIRIAKWNGAAWSALGSGVSALVHALAVDGSGNLYAGGVFTTAGGVIVSNIAKWNGTTWSALGSGVGGYVYTLVVDGSGNLYAGGNFPTAGEVAANYIAKWNGTVWSALGSGVASNSVAALALDGSGKLYVGGNFTTAGGVSANNIAQWNGTVWSALALDSGGWNNLVLVLTVDGSGNLYAGGEFTTAGGVAANRIAKWNGTTWSALGSGVNYAPNPSFVNALAVDGSGNLYAGGLFTTAGGVAAKGIAKWNGTAWSTLGSGLGNSAGPILVHALVVDSSGKLYAGGVFTTAGGVAANYIAKWNGTTWSALGSGMSNSVLALALDGNDNLYAGGSFTTAGGVANTKCIAKWNGTAWSALGSGMNGGVNALVVDSGNNLYAGGLFSTAGGVEANRIAKWNGMVWSALGSGMSNGNFQSGVYALALDGSGSLYAGGSFTTAGDKVSAYMAKWLALDTDADGVPDAVDAFPNNPAEWLDTDSDGTGNNVDTDDDADTLDDSADNCVLMANLDQLDTDNDLQGNACDSDDDGDGVADTSDAFPLDATETTDTDHDTVGNNADNCVAIANTNQLNTDNDLQGNACDSDDDGDGVADTLDAFSLDATESADTDSDGIGDNADNCALVANPDQLDGDSDQQGDVCDLFPLDDFLLFKREGAANTKLGRAVALADMNADGFSDVLVGAPLTHSVNGVLLQYTGSITVYSGRDGAVLNVFNGTTAGQLFGVAFTVVDDQNADNVPDLVVGEPFADVTIKVNGKLVRMNDAGRVALYSGSDGALLQTLMEGQHTGYRFGAAVAVGDVNGDAQADLIVGEPYARTTVRQGGRVLVFDGLSSNLQYSRLGHQAGERFGSAVAVDNQQRLFIGSPLSDFVRLGKIQSNVGGVKVFAGVDGINAALLVLEGRKAGDNFGSSIAVANDDLDADGEADWVVGSPYADGFVRAGVFVKNIGAVQLFSGLNTMPVVTLYGRVGGERFGAALGMGGDVNNDGSHDLAIGAPLADKRKVIVSKVVWAQDAWAKDAGRVEVLSGAVLAAP